MRTSKAMIKSTLGILAWVCFLALTNVAVTQAAEYPSQAVKLIVPWAAGGDTDAVMRVVAHFAGKYLGQTMVVINVPGVGGTLGARQGKDAKPDGYTLTATHESVISSKIVGVADFDYSSFIPIANLVNTPAMVAARGNAPWNSMKEAVADAKKRPGEITFGATLGSTSHFFPLDIGHQTGIDLKIVGYEGTAQRQAALLGGFIDLGESNPAVGQQYFQTKKLKPLGIATPKRHRLLPDVPTLSEQGVEVIFGVNRGVCTPLNTPKQVIDKLSKVFEKVAQDMEFIKKIQELGSDVVYFDQAGYRSYIDAELKRLEILAVKFNIKAPAPKK